MEVQRPSCGALLELSSGDSEVRLSGLGRQAAQAIWRHQLATQAADGYHVADASLQQTDATQHEHVATLVSAAFGEILHHVATLLECVAGIMLRLEDEHESLIEDRVSQRAFLLQVHAAADALSALAATLAAWLRADGLVLPALSKDWASHVATGAHAQHRQLASLLDLGVPVAIDHVAVCLKQQAGCCEDAAGLAAWATCLGAWLQLRDTVQTHGLGRWLDAQSACALQKSLSDRAATTARPMPTEVSLRPKLRRDSGRQTGSAAEARAAQAARPAAARIQTKASAPLATRMQELAVAAASCYARGAEGRLGAAFAEGTAAGSAALSQMCLDGLAAICESLGAGDEGCPIGCSVASGAAESARDHRQGVWTSLHGALSLLRPNSGDVSGMCAGAAPAATRMWPYAQPSLSRRRAAAAQQLYAFLLLFLQEAAVAAGRPAELRWHVAPCSADIVRFGAAGAPLALPLDATAAVTAAAVRKQIASRDSGAGQAPRADVCIVSGASDQSPADAEPAAQGTEARRADEGCSTSSAVPSAASPGQPGPQQAAPLHDAATIATSTDARSAPASAPIRTHPDACGEEGAAAPILAHNPAQPTPASPGAREAADPAVLRTQPRDGGPMMSPPRKPLNAAAAKSALTDYLFSQTAQRPRRGVAARGGGRLAGSGSPAVSSTGHACVEGLSGCASTQSATCLDPNPAAGAHASVAPCAVGEGHRGGDLGLRHPSSSQHSSAQHSIPHAAVWAQRPREAQDNFAQPPGGGPFACGHMVSAAVSSSTSRASTSAAAAPPWALPSRSGAAAPAPLDHRASNASEHSWGFAERRSDAAAQRLGKPAVPAAVQPPPAPRGHRGSGQVGTDNPWRAALLRLRAEELGLPVAEARAPALGSGAGDTSWRHARATFSAIELGAGPFSARERDSRSHERVESVPPGAAMGCEAWIRGEFAGANGAKVPPVVAADRIAGLGPVLRRPRQRRWIAWVRAPAQHSPGRSAAREGGCGGAAGPVAEGPMRAARQRRLAAAAKVAPQPCMSLRQRLRLSMSGKDDRGGGVFAQCDAVDDRPSLIEPAAEAARFSEALPHVPLTPTGAAKCDVAVPPPPAEQLRWSLPVLALQGGAAAPLDDTCARVATWGVQRDVLSVQATLQRLRDSGRAGDTVPARNVQEAGTEGGVVAEFSAAHVCAYILEVVRGFEIVRRHLRAEPPSHSKAAPAPTLQPSSARERAAVRRAAARSAERLLAAAAAWVCSEAACAHARGDVARVALLYGNALDLFAPLRAVLRELLRNALRGLPPWDARAHKLHACMASDDVDLDALLGFPPEATGGAGRARQSCAAWQPLAESPYVLPRADGGRNSDDALEDTRRWLFSPWEWAALRQLLDTRAQVAASADALAVLPTPHVSALLRSRAATLDGWLVVPEARSLSLFAQAWHDEVIGPLRAAAATAGAQAVFELLSHALAVYLLSVTRHAQARRGAYSRRLALRELCIQDAEALLARTGLVALGAEPAVRRGRRRAAAPPPHEAALDHLNEALEGLVGEGDLRGGGCCGGWRL